VLEPLKTVTVKRPQLPSLVMASWGAKSWATAAIWTSCLCTKTTDERAQEIYANYVRKMINWMTVKTAEGDLYEIDTALRPNGNSGMLVTQFEAYADYQQQRGSNTAWTWEHQAMTRARFVMGLPSLAAQFDQVRHSVIGSPRDALSLKAEIVAMRERVHQGHPVKADRFDVKHSPGAMVDAEFAVQYLVLLHSPASRVGRQRGQYCIAAAG
jgi:[glutamine synthetase] adenylyltransferase / [glutamine synthetase]-adenylyl-L-tyrosine phosphorylase